MPRSDPADESPGVIAPLSQLGHGPTTDLKSADAIDRDRTASQFPAAAIRGGGLARAEKLEWRCDPRARRRADGNRRGLPGDPDDTHSRYIEAAIGDALVGCLYMPNGNPAPGPLNSRYFRPVRRKETRSRRWDLQFESTSLQRRVSCEPDFVD
jgi:hypothetical protein